MPDIKSRFRFHLPQVLYGKTFGRLEVLSPEAFKQADFCLCWCVCGRPVWVLVLELMNGTKNDCGSCSRPTKYHPNWTLLDDDGRDWSWAFVIYKDVPGYEGYIAGSDGTVWSRRIKGKGSLIRKWMLNWKWLVPNRTSKKLEYQSVFLACGDGKPKRFHVHQIIARTFLGEEPTGAICCHFPHRDPTNNTIQNLRWATRSDNESDAVSHGTRIMGSHHPIAKIAEDDVRRIRRLKSEGWTSKALAAEYNMNYNNINKILSRRAWAHVD